MRAAVRSSVVLGFVVACVLTLGWSAPLAALVRLTGTTALIMGGTQHPLVNPSDRLPDVDGHPHYGFSEDGLADGDGLPFGYVGSAMSTYIVPGGADGALYNVLATWTPEAFWPVFGAQTFNKSVQAGLANLDGCLTGGDCIAHRYAGGPGGDPDGFAVYSYSQSARIASLEKAKLIGAYQDTGVTLPPPPVAFTMVANPNRPNGGVLQRFKGLYIPILDVSFDGSTRTDSPVIDGKYLYPTVDIARQYDGWTDFPVNPINLLADLNAALGILFLHPDYFAGNTSNPVAGQPYLSQGQAGDTNYYMIGTRRLPLLLPLAAIGVPDPILAALDAPLRVLVEWGYNRAVSPGVPTGANLFYLPNLFKGVANLMVATFTGLDDMISQFAHDPTARPFHTAPVESPFGVGGIVLPKVTHAVPPVGPAAEPQTSAASQQAALATKAEPVAPESAPAGHDVAAAAAPPEAPDPPAATVPDDAGAPTTAPVDSPRKRPGVTRPHRTESTRTAAESADRTPRAGGPRHRIKHTKNTNDVAGQPDSAPKAAAASAPGD